jgi:hypothetical protein
MAPSGLASGDEVCLAPVVSPGALAFVCPQPRAAEVSSRADRRSLIFRLHWANSIIAPMATT